ncbi:MAG: WYL domain-containing protein [Actinomycetota bacterium]
MSRAVQRVRRLLAMVPFIIQHPGVPIGELAELFGGSEDEIASDLNLLFLTGIPPYGPGELIDVDIEEDRVWISMADYFSRPLRLTRNEAVALYLRGKAVLGTPGLQEAPALAAALEKIETALGDELGDVAERVETAGTATPPESLDLLRTAAAARRRVQIEYYSAARDDVSVRTVDPEQIFSASGFWYVVAWDEGVEDTRTFRLDRIRDARLAEGSFTPRGLADPHVRLYEPAAGDPHVRLRLHPEAGWVAEYYEAKVRSRSDDGSMEIELSVTQLAWVVKLVLRLRGRAQVLEPDELRRRVREEAVAGLANYR